jgi:DNA-3-methyladenine glycosylase
LTKYLQIDRSWNRQLVAPENQLWLATSPTESKIPASHIKETPRIGVKSAGEEWSQKPWRFVWQEG